MTFCAIRNKLEKCITGENIEKNELASGILE